jgi:DNA-binding Lrp family transcriptional regulator
MDEKRIRETVEKTAEDGRMPCREALRIADELKVSREEVGKILNELKIKIVHCQLGCFP